MRIVVLSDTHASQLSEIPGPLLTALDEADLIIHAGDFTQKAVLDGLRTMGEVKAVCGNMDSGELKSTLPQKEQFTVGGKRIGLVHGSGGHWGIADRMREMFDDVDIIIYGHSHEPCNRYIGETLLFNPGRGRDSFGLITIDDEIRAEIKQF